MSVIIPGFKNEGMALISVGRFLSRSNRKKKMTSQCAILAQGHKVHYECKIGIYKVCVCICGEREGKYYIEPQMLYTGYQLSASG